MVRGFSSCYIFCQMLQFLICSTVWEWRTYFAEVLLPAFRWFSPAVPLFTAHGHSISADQTPWSEFSNAAYNKNCKSYFELHKFRAEWEKAMATHSSTLAWKIPWTEGPGGLQSMGSLGVGHDWETSLSLFTFYFHALEKEMATHSSVLAWRVPGTGEPGGLPSVGSHRVGHDWSDLAAAAAELNSCSLFLGGFSDEIV